MHSIPKVIFKSTSGISDKGLQTYRHEELCCFKYSNANLIYLQFKDKDFEWIKMSLEFTFK